MVMTMSSSAMRSSIENSPSADRISVRRCVAVLGLELQHLALNEIEHPPLAGQDRLVLGDHHLQLGVLLLDLVALEAGEARQPHVEDRLGLHLGEPEAGA